MSTCLFFVGTYTKRGSKGIYALRLDLATGQLSTPSLAAEASNPTYLALSPSGKFLYAVSDAPSMATGYTVDRELGRLLPLTDPQPSAGRSPSHIAIDQSGRIALVANYHQGFVASVPLDENGRPGAPASIVKHAGSSVNPDRQAGPHPHCVTLSPDNRHVLVCDLGLDKIFTYQLAPDTASLTPGEPPFIVSVPGAGPRHLAFAPDGQHAFMISEMGGAITSYRYDAGSGALTSLDSETTLSSSFTGENKSAAIRVHPNGRFVYGSNRGPDTIAVLGFDPATGRLSPVEMVASGGKSPRDIALTPDGNWLIAAHEESDNLTVFRVDSATGRLTPTPASANISMPVCIVFADR